MRRFALANTVISDSGPCYVIAELGHNHCGSVDTAKALIRAAAEAGAHAVKLQKRDNATLYSPAMREMVYNGAHSFGATYGAHREALELNDAEFSDCMQQASQSNIACFATAFDESSVDFLMRHGVPAIKIASGALTDTALLTYAAQCRVPLIISTGGGTLLDIDRAVNTVTAFHRDVAVLHCTAAYPVTKPAELNLRCIETLRAEYTDIVIGWSSHDPGTAMCHIAFALGARIIEKHFTLDQKMKGNDQAWSLEPDELRKLCLDLQLDYEAMGSGVKTYFKSELEPISKMRRRYTPSGWQITGAMDASTD